MSLPTLPHVKNQLNSLRVNMFVRKITIPLTLILIRKSLIKTVLEKFRNIISNDIALNYCEGDIQKV